MSKYNEVSPEIQQIFDDVISKTGLQDYVGIKILVDNTLKHPYLVVKTNEIVKHFTSKMVNQGYDVLVIINEEVFESITPEQQKILVDDTITNISYDSEKDKVVISKSEINVNVGVMKKYGMEDYINLKETIVLFFQQLAEKQKDEKEHSKKVK